MEENDYMYYGRTEYVPRIRDGQFGSSLKPFQLHILQYKDRNSVEIPW